MAGLQSADEIIGWCRELAACSDAAGATTRTFLSPATKIAHQLVRARMRRAGLAVSVDAAGNLRGFLAGCDAGHPRLLIGSHIDTVPNAGAFDGVLGVALGIALVEGFVGRRLPFHVEVIAFSEEEGVRFGAPFLGSRALTGTLTPDLLARKDAAGITVAQAIRDFGLDPECLGHAVLQGPVAGYIEFHIEQGPVLEYSGAPLGVVDAIAGQTRARVCFSGTANHAGTTPMHLRKDALAAAAEWIGSVEREARNGEGLVATVGRVEVSPGASNVIAGQAVCSLDVRHAHDATRKAAHARILQSAQTIASARGIAINYNTLLDQEAVAMDPTLSAALERAAVKAGYSAPRLVSGAGHDAMILASKVPAAMLFLRSPGGISHHPDESVLPADVAAALLTGRHFLESFDALGGMVVCNE